MSLLAWALGLTALSNLAEADEETQREVDRLRDKNDANEARIRHLEEELRRLKRKV